MNMFKKKVTNTVEIKKYSHLVTFSYIEHGQQLTMRTMLTARSQATATEWNDFIKSIPELEKRDGRWIVMSVITLKN